MGDVRAAIEDLHEKGRLPEAEEAGARADLQLVLGRFSREADADRLCSGEQGSRAHLAWYHHLLRDYRLHRAIHLPPRASFPGALADGRGLSRPDVLDPWGPSYRIVAECQSYQYHDNHEGFERDRASSRALHHRGFKVLQYSGGKIWRDPFGVSSDLLSHLVDAYPYKDELPGYRAGEPGNANYIRGAN